MPMSVNKLLLAKTVLEIGFSTHPRHNYSHNTQDIPVCKESYQCTFTNIPR